MDDVPNVRFVELGFQLLADRCFDIKHSEGTSDIEEQGSESEPHSWTYPTKESGRTKGFECRVWGRVRMVRSRTVCPFQKPCPQGLLRNGPASRPSGTVPDRMCVAQGTQFHRSIPP